MRISKREAKFIHPAVVYRWEINIQHWRKSAMWDDDPLMPVKIGALAEGLIEKGILERVDIGMNCARIRLTRLGASFSCLKCYRGTVFIDAENSDETKPCPYCVNGVRLDNGIRGEGE